MLSSLPVLLPLAVLGPLAAPPSAQNVPRAPVLVHGSPVNGTEPVVASDGNLAAACWNDAATEDIFVSTSDARGIVWTAPVRVDSGTTFVDRDTEVWSLAVVGNSIYVAWRDERAGVDFDDIYLNVSNDGGATWIGERRVPNGYTAGVAGVRDWRMRVQAGAPSSRVYFLLAVDPAPNSTEELWFVASSDGGASFGSPLNPSSLAHGAADVDDIDLAAAGSSVYIAWRDDRFGANDEIFFQKSANAGGAWLAADLIVSNSADARDGDDQVAVAVNGSRVAVAMQEDTSASTAEELRVNVSTNGGTSFAGAVKVGTYTTGVDDADLRPGSLAVLDDGTIVIAWVDDRLGALPDQNEVWVSRSIDAGATWIDETRVSVNRGGAPKIAIDGARVALTWSDGGGNDEAATTYSEDSGATWATTFYVNDTLNGGDVDDPFVAFNAATGNLLFVWLQAPSTTNDVMAGGYCLCLDGAPPASATFRNGTGVNPANYTSVNPPILGDSWKVDLDCSGHAPAAAFVLVKTTPIPGTTTAYGQLLLAGPTLLGVAKPHGGGVAHFSMAVPSDVALCGLTAPSQGLCFGSPSPRLSNALDLRIGR